MRILIRYTKNFCNHTNTLDSGWQHGVSHHQKPSCELQWKSHQQIKESGTLTLTHPEAGSGILHWLPPPQHSPTPRPVSILPWRGAFQSSRVYCCKVPYWHKSRGCGSFWFVINLNESLRLLLAKLQYKRDKGNPMHLSNWNDIDGILKTFHIWYLSYMPKYDIIGVTS